MILPAIPITVGAETQGYYTYKISDGKATITDVDTSISGNVIIPQILGGCPVTGIGFSSFAQCKNIVNVVIPNGVTNIEQTAFSSCSKLEKVTIPDSVINIGPGAFQLTKIANDKNNWQNGGLYIGKYLITVGDVPKDEVETFEIKNGTRCIAGGAFSGCTNLKNISVPNSVIGIGDSAFSGCASLTSIDIPRGLINIGYKAFASCCSLENITIPDSVTSIGDGAFSGCINLTSINISNGVNSIGKNAFADCSGLISVIIPDSVTSIGYDAFSGCTGLQNVTLSGNINVLSALGFETCENLKSVVIGDGTTIIEHGAFYGCKSIKEVKVPKSVQTINDIAFANCGNLNITVEENNPYYSSIEGVLFNKDKTKIIAYAKDKSQPKYSIPVSTTSIDRYAFDDCSSLTSVTIPNSVTSIGESAFYGCNNLINITIPNGVTEILEYTFTDCSSLKKIALPKSLKTVGRVAFDGCLSLTDVYYDGSEEEWNKIEISRGTTELGGDNSTLTNATIHYNSGTDTEPTKFAGVPTVSAGNGVYNVSATLQDIDKSCVMVAAVYNGRKLAGVKIINLSKGQTSAVASVSAVRADTAKVCIWDSAKNMKPLCEPKIITIK